MNRWLTGAAVALGVAVGHAAADAPVTVNPARDQNMVLYPRSAEPSPAAKTAPTPSGTMSVVLVCILGAAGGWMLWQKLRSRGPLGQGGRLLNIAETKSLGNRQFLVVASYQDRKFLLGVCPGRIDLLTPLDSSDSAPTPPPSFPL